MKKTVRQDKTIDVSTRKKVNEPSLPALTQDPILTKLEGLQVIRNRYQRWMSAKLPILLVLLLLADWLIGPQVFAKDLFRLSGILCAIVELLVVNYLFAQAPQTLKMVWIRGLIVSTDDTPKKFSDFLHTFEQALNRQSSILVGVAFAIAVAITTYPVRYWSRTGHSPYSDMSQFFRLSSGGVIFAEVLLAYFIGLMVWRSGVIAFFINRLSGEFQVRIQPKHPDRSGGLKPLGDLCLTNAFLILVPTILLSFWVAMKNQPGFEGYALWSDIFRKWLLVLSIASIFLFFRPLYSIHQQMKEQKCKVQCELDELSFKMEEILLELRTKADVLSPDKGAERLKRLEFLRKIYEENRKIPTWPFDWHVIVKFAIAQAVPVLSFIGIGEPMIRIVSSLLESLPNQ